jgi:hypothetical protein
MNTRSLSKGLLFSLAFLPALALAHGDEEHGDHDAAHGGFVMMYEDLHFEVTALPAGGIQVYFTDAQRSELPAATVSDVAVEIERMGAPIESVTMAMSAGGDFWEGASQPATEADAIVRVGFFYAGKPLMLDVPVSALVPAEAEEPDTVDNADPEAASETAQAGHAGAHDGH